MTGVIASAPGKVVLCGEYAVLDGAPAVCLAVNRRAKVRIDRADTDWNRVLAPGYSSIEGRFISRDKSPEWLQGEDEFKLLDAAWRRFGRPGQRGLSIELDTRSFFDAASGEKIGLGSSAALTVALVAALTELDGVLARAIDVHRTFQHGAGSGVDIAAAVSGGLIEYRMERSKVSTLDWPDGLSCRLVWTGVPASTGSRLDRLEQVGQRPSRRVLADAAARMAAAWHSASTVVADFPQYIEALRRFSDDYDLGIFDAGHERLAAEADAAGLIYKPCGAGGGDVGMLLGKNNSELDDFVMSMDSNGYRILGCQMDAEGVTRVRL